LKHPYPRQHGRVCPPWTKRRASRCSAVQLQSMRNNNTNMTQNNTSSYREKGRAVFLAAIMVLSVVAGSAAFAGSSAAVLPDQSNDYDNTLGGELVYQGQEFNVSDLNGTNAFDGDIATGADTIYLIEVEETNDTGAITDARTVRPLTYNATGNEEALVDTTDLEAGDYTLSTQTGSAGTNLDSFEVTEQTLDASWDSDSVTEVDNDTFVELDTDRTSRQNVTVSADGMDAADLKALFQASGDELVQNDGDVPLDRLGYDRDDNDGWEDAEDDGYVTLNLDELETNNKYNNDGELTANFTNLDNNADFPNEGDYEFEFLVTDTTAEDTATVSVTEDDQDASFNEGVVQTGAGDIAEFEIELEDTDGTFVQIGDEEAGFVDVIYVEDGDDDDTVSFQVNTRILGTNENTNQVYDAGDDETIVSAVHDGDSAIRAELDSANALFVDSNGDALTNGFGEYLYELDLIQESNEGNNLAGQSQLARPLQAAEYDIVVAGDVAGNDGVFSVDDGESAAEEELANALLELTQPEIGEITTHVAPTDDADADDELDQILDTVTQREDIAIEDRLVVQVEATGIYGAMVDQADGGSNFDILEDGTSGQTLYNIVDATNEEISFSVEADDATGNQDPTAIDFENTDTSEIFIVPDNDGGQFFVIADTSESDVFSNGEPSDGDTYTAELEYDADFQNQDRYEFDRHSNDFVQSGAFEKDNSTQGYPYLLSGETLSTSTEIDFQDASVDFDNVNVDDVLEAENIEDSEISGTTNVAPGTDGEIRVSSTDATSSFRNGESINISEDGSISAEFDFSNQEVDDEFETSFQVGGSAVDTVDSIIVEEGSLSEDAPEDDESMDDGESDDSASDDSASDDSASDDGESDDSSSEETPGFGAIVALVAVLGAALLATRRQN